MFYLATTAGTYTYLGGLVVAAGEVAFLCYDGTWTEKSSALLSTGSIVDNTTTEDATKPLSAKQGKVLADAGAATAAEVTALGHKVDGLALGKFYGFFPAAADLPAGDDAGYAYVGVSAPFAIYVFEDGAWSDSGSVQQYDPPMPNMEDIDFNEDGELQFANRISGDGMGYKILRTDATFASQVTAGNTIYEIRYDFDLGGASVTIPAGCILRFAGGRLSNGTLVGSDTIIDAPIGRQIFDGVAVGGTFDGLELPVSWWIDKTKTDNTADVQRALDAIDFFPNTKYFTFDTPVSITDIGYVNKYSPRLVIRGGVSKQSSFDIFVTGANSQGLDLSGTANIGIQDLSIVGDDNNVPRTLIFCSRTTTFNTCGDYLIENLKMYGSASVAFFYNYSGESVRFLKSHFQTNTDGGSAPHQVYLTGSNSKGLTSKFTTTFTSITPCTGHSFQNCTFRSISDEISNGILWEAGENTGWNQDNILSGAFYNCYFGMRNGIPVNLVNCMGGMTFIGCIDESRTSASSSDFPFLKIEKTAGFSLNFNGLSIVGCSFYPKSGSVMLDAADIQVAGFVFIGNFVGRGCSLSFQRLRGGYATGLSTGTKIISSQSVFNFHTDTAQADRTGVVDYATSLALPTPSSKERGFQAFKIRDVYSVEHDIDQPVWFDGTTWRNALGRTPDRIVGTTAQRPTLSLNLDKGYLYFDTSLSPARLIVWNGSTWTNLDGSALA